MPDARAIAKDALETPGGPDEAVLGWLEDGLRFWCSIQHPDGSHDEAYPWERSLAATAFTTVYVSEALAFLGDDLDAAVAERTRGTIERVRAIDGDVEKAKRDRTRYLRQRARSPKENR